MVVRLNALVVSDEDLVEAFDMVLKPVFDLLAQLRRQGRMSQAELDEFADDHRRRVQAVLQFLHDADARTVRPDSQEEPVN